MGRQKTSLYNENLTVSRIHVALRPFETKLNVLAKTLQDRKVAENKYAPSQRLRGVTYAKRHRIRALTGMSVQQASRAYALEKSHGLSTRFGFHEQVIGVEDAFRNLVRATQTTLPDGQQRVLSLQTMLSKMIGRQVAEETLRDKEELEEEGVDDCIGLWYGDLTVHCRKDALIAHAIELVVLKIPVFILELWKGLLTITMQAHLSEESSILLEDILLYYLTPNPTASDSTSNSSHLHTSGRDLTDLYTQFTTYLPSADFFSVLLPILESSPPAIWRIRAVQHLIRHLDDDLTFTCRILDRAAVASCCFINNSAPSSSQKSPLQRDDIWMLKQIEFKALSLLGVLITDGPQILDKDLVHEITHLSWTLWVLGQHLRRCEEQSQITELACALDLHTLLLATQHSPSLDTSDIIERLSTPKLVNGPNADKLLYILIQALKLFEPRTSNNGTLGDIAPSATPDINAHCNALIDYGLDALAERLKGTCEKINEHPRDGRLDYADLAIDIGSLKRKWMSQGVEGASKSRRLGNGGHFNSQIRQKTGDDSTDSDDSEGWTASVSGEDTAGEVDEDEDSEDALVESTTGNSVAAIEEEVDDEEATPTFREDDRSLRFLNEEEESDVEKSEMPKHRSLVLQPSNRSLSIGGRGAAPLLQSVVNEKIRDLLQSRVIHAAQRRSRERDEDDDYFGDGREDGYVEHSRGTMPSSDDDLDLLGRDVGWSTP